MEKFGMHHVDFNDPSRPRTPKASALYYAQIIKDNGFKNKANGKTASLGVVLVCLMFWGLN